jgi:hypothetical protein
MLEGLTIGIVIDCIGLAIAVMRRGCSAIGSRPRLLQSFSVAGNPENTLKTIDRFAPQAGYKISAIDEVQGQLVREEFASVTSLGLFFPMFVSRQSEHFTLVEFDVSGKLVHAGPIVSRSHQGHMNGIKAALFASR